MSDVASNQAASMDSPSWLGEKTLPDGAVIRFRHVQPSDEALIGAAINSASRETLLHRFFSPIRAVSPAQLHQMLALDRIKETCIVGLLENSIPPRIVCGARYVKLSRHQAAEIALTVHDDFQRRGLGTYLLKLLARLAAAEQLECFEAEVLSGNHKMLTLFRKLTHGQAQGNWTGDVYHLEIPVRLLAEWNP